MYSYYDLVSQLCLDPVTEQYNFSDNLNLLTYLLDLYPSKEFSYVLDNLRNMLTNDPKWINAFAAKITDLFPELDLTEYDKKYICYLGYQINDFLTSFDETKNTLLIDYLDKMFPELCIDSIHKFVDVFYTNTTSVTYIKH